MSLIQKLRHIRFNAFGDTIISTLDVNVQRIVEKKIKEFRSTWKCENTGVIVMNPNNGAIYAMVSNEGFDLNEPRNLSAYYTQEEIEAMSEEETLNASAQNRNAPGSGRTHPCLTVHRLT